MDLEPLYLWIPVIYFVTFALVDQRTVLCELIASEPVDGRHPITISCGVASARMGEDAGQLLQRADRALYEAKRGGRNCVQAAD